uniref:Uncharacterized protein n=1 Tax=Trypanosoma congolense (strain IL3000) TaxID=1068625 RepID=G0UU53_TRYCI|nr:conserved hypothetical protein [Trypanosoma congolense IL3000]
MAQGGVVEISPDFVPLEHVQRGMKNADCRTPVIFFKEDGDPYMSLCKIASETDSAVWYFDYSYKVDIDVTLDYIEVGSNNGDWVFITNCGEVGQHFFRKIALMIFCLKPEPKKYPRREFFRCVFCSEKVFGIDDHVNAPLPPLILANSIVARLADGSCKWSLRMPSELTCRMAEEAKRQKRRSEGRDSDSETDLDDDEALSGKWFHRSVELNKAIDEAPLAMAHQKMRQALMEEDVVTIKSLIVNGEYDIEREIVSGMTPLQYACSVEKTKSAICLLECGADPNQPRKSDGRPPLFMAIEDTSLAKALIKHGADLHARFQGYRVDNHPDTAPEVARLAEKARKQM